MDVAAFLLEKGLLGGLLLWALWERQKMQDRLFEEHQKRLQDAKDGTQAQLLMNDKVHQALTSMANLAETIGKRPPT